MIIVSCRLIIVELNAQVARQSEPATAGDAADAPYQLARVACLEIFSRQRNFLFYKLVKRKREGSQ